MVWGLLDFEFQLPHTKSEHFSAQFQPKRNMPCFSKVSRMVDLLSRFKQHLDSCKKARSQRWSLRKLGRPWVGAPYGIVKHGCLGNLQSGSRSILQYFNFVDPKDQEFWFHNQCNTWSVQDGCREGWDVCPLEPVVEFHPHETSHRMRYAFWWEMFWPSFLYSNSITFARSLEFFFFFFSNTF